MRKPILVIMTAILVLALATVAMAADPHVGTWKLNVAKSKFSPGTAPKSGTLKMDVQDNGLKVVSDGVDAEGKASHSEFAAKYDGKDYPVTGDPDVDTVSLTKIDANTVDYVQKKDGKEVQRGRTVISRDGKTWTLPYKAKDAQGRNVNNIEIFDRQ
jgi:hypothetical protein